MKNFFYLRARDATQAVQFASMHPGAKFLAGGTNLVDLMREDIERPDALIDVSGLALDSITEEPDGSLLIGAAVRNTAVALNGAVRSRYPMLAQAILNGASGQIRNMATVGGNLMQRTRCYYFYDTASRCNKRKAGSGCDALQGFSRIHAILGTSANCIATHPSDMCVALAALDATVRVEGPEGARDIPFAEFHRLPGDTPGIETSLAAGELIVGIRLAAMDFVRQSLYRKVRDRASYAFALVSVAAALEISGGTIRNVRIALGGVAHKPWRAREAERRLLGGQPSAQAFAHAADAELQASATTTHNAFKIELARRTIVGALQELAAKGSAS